MSAKPAGVHVRSRDRVRWELARDANRIVLGAQVVAVIGLLIVRRDAVVRPARTRSPRAPGTGVSGRR